MATYSKNGRLGQDLEPQSQPPPTPPNTITTSSSIASFSPISTLARQYLNQPASASEGRVLIAVHCSSACCVSLDEVWKARKHQGTSSSSATAPHLEGAVRRNDLPDDQLEENSPFSFLDSENESSVAKETMAGEPTTTAQTSATSVNKSKKPNLGRFLKSIAATSTQALERGMHQLAVKADQGKSPDRLVLGLYETQTGALLDATEAAPLPVVRADGIHFRIPLVIPATTMETITIKLWIRSGAALAASKHYPIAETAPLDVAKLRASLAQERKANVPVAALFFPVPFLPSSLIIDGKLNCIAISDNKFPVTCGKGWSLQDPNPATAYSVAAAGMFNLPLDQSYFFAIPNRPPPPPMTTLLATERSVESSVVLPLATAWARMASEAARLSMDHLKSVTQTVLYHRHDSDIGERASVQMRLSHFQTNHASSQLFQSAKGYPTVSISFQRPNSIFEVELLPPTKLPLHPKAAGGLHGSEDSIRCQFHPKPVRDGILPAILNQIPGQRLRQGQFLLGNVRLLVSLPRGRSLSGDNVVVPVNPFDALDPSNAVAFNKNEGSAGTAEVWDCILPLDIIMHDASKNGRSQEVLLYDLVTGQVMGSVVFTLSIQMIQESDSSRANVPATGGLVDLVGLPHLTDGVLPALDFCEHNATDVAPELQRRRSQLATMGIFATHDYLDYHQQHVRLADASLLDERVAQYQRALDAALGQAPPPEHLPSHQDRTPRPFRPSASRSTMLLSGIGFNVHTASFSLDLLDSTAAARCNGMPTQSPPGAIFHNITCGAPADHARGFGDVFASPKGREKGNGGSNSGSIARSPMSMDSPLGPATGGLRRLEATRRALATHVSNEQTTLVMLIQNYFVEQRQQRHRGRPVTHVPSRHAELQSARRRVFEAVQCLHHLTWTCTVRRASVFSQALGIAVSSYLSSVSDGRTMQSTWPEHWTRHGYLVSFEGLLSAAGKELGMIEDASVAIGMLQNVRVILVPDDGAADVNRCPVPHSLYLRWVHLWSVQTDPGDAERVGTQYVLQIGMIPSYFDQRIPAPLKNSAAVRFFSLLFEVGVDIFQAASNAGSNMSKTYQSGGCSAAVPELESSRPSLTEDEEDDGVVDDDVLVQLNYEAFQKMNYYAQSVSPASPVQATPTHQTHPLLAALFQHIVSSSGKMNHDILDEAAQLAQQLGGGGCVFCKSGKDRTAMHVTYKQAQFETRFRAKLAGINALNDAADSMMQGTTLADAMLIRLHGTRLPICEKNVGQSKYAFNSLQVKFMPDALKPPTSALAGFLKGGKVFGKGGIES